MQYGINQSDQGVTLQQELQHLELLENFINKQLASLQNTTVKEEQEIKQALGTLHWRMQELTHQIQTQDKRLYRNQLLRHFFEKYAVIGLFLLIIANLLDTDTSLQLALFYLACCAGLLYFFASRILERGQDILRVFIIIAIFFVLYSFPPVKAHMTEYNALYTAAGIILAIFLR